MVLARLPSSPARSLRASTAERFQPMLRFSAHIFNTKSDIVRALQTIRATLA
jgi:selenocysteine lyase/cysteine desulfurase